VNIEQKITGRAFDAALNRHVTPKSHHSLNACNRTMRAILLDIEVKAADLQENITLYIQVRDRICDLSKSL
jgi:hypothetical protein